MVVKGVQVLAVVVLLAQTAVAQREAPLFLDSRSGEDPAVMDVTEVTGLYPKEAVEQYEKGVSEARKGNRAAAREHLEAAIRIEPDFFNAHNSLAILFHRMTQYRDAERQYREASRLNPRSVAPLVNMASLFVEEALSLSRTDPQTARIRLNEALASLNKAFEIQPSAALANYWSGVVYYLTAFYEESESYFKKALATGDPRMVLAHLALADIYVRLKEWDSVVVQLDQYLEAVPFASNRARVRAARGAAFERLEASSQ
jgi:tetratricopeptide (TPR) repeat protein